MNRLQRIRKLNRNERGVALIEGIAWMAAVALMLWVIYGVLAAAAPLMVDAWTRAGVNQRNLYEMRGQMPQGW